MIDVLISVAIGDAVLGLVALLFLASIWVPPGSPAQDVKHPVSLVPTAFDAIHPTDANSPAQIADAAVRSSGAKGRL